MKTVREVEEALCDVITSFQKEHMGRVPGSIRSYLVGDLILIRLQGVLTAAEKRLVKSQPPETGRNLIKQVRTHLIEVSKPILEAIVFEVTETKMVSLHYDISTITGEEVILFTLASSPPFRETKKK